MNTLPIYLDYMATTPVDPRVISLMQAYLGFDGDFGNPASRTHIYGWRAEEAVERARQEVADLIYADPKEIIWTSGATEANNLAIKGAAYFYQRKGKHIITCKTEHKAVLDVCAYLEKQGFEVTYLNVQENGLIDLNELAEALRPDTLLVSIMLVNNEIGVIQDIAAIGELTRQQGILLHVDAAQAPGKIVIDLRNLPVDLMSFSAHKAYGPKGIGALYVRKQPRVRLEPLLHGGGHELGLRSGTLATHQIVGMGKAFSLVKQEMTADIEKISRLQQQFWHELKKIPEIYLNGDAIARVPHNLNISFAGVDGEALLLSLKDLAVSSGSACTSATIEPSHVLKALGLSNSLAQSAIRFSLGKFITAEEIRLAAKQVQESVARLREMSPLWSV
jgi:cysteine desulfurase